MSSLSEDLATLKDWETRVPPILEEDYICLLQHITLFHYHKLGETKLKKIPCPRCEGSGFIRVLGERYIG